MTTTSARVPAGALALVIAVAACTSGGSTPSSVATVAPPTEPPPTAVPAPSGGAGSSGNPGIGVPIPVEPGGGIGSGGGPPQPEPTIVSPVSGLLGVHSVGAVALDGQVDGRHASVRVSWWSGVEPCNSLAGVDVARDGSTFNLTVREGASRLDVACIEIAVYKATVVDLGELDPGDYTVTAFGDAPPLPLSIGG